MSYLSAYTDSYLDTESALHYMNARYYDSDLKRFTSVDPPLVELDKATRNKRLRNPQDLGAYTYVLNNPLKYNDPTGEAYHEVGADLTILAANIEFGYRVDHNGRVDGYIGGGPAAGLYAGVSEWSSTKDLPEDNFYMSTTMTGEAALIAGVQVEGSYTSSNPWGENWSTDTMVGVDGRAGVTTAVGASVGWSGTANFTVFDPSLDTDLARQVSSQVTSAINNLTNFYQESRDTVEWVVDNLD